MADTSPALRIVVDDLTGDAIRSLLEEHLANMYEVSPPESVHALDLDGLRAPSVTFWTAWSGDLLVGCGALKQLDASHGEIKSMRTPANLRRRGAGRALLGHILGEARARGYRRISLETGAEDAFEPARRLYTSFGFTYCAPFGHYIEDPNSVFMTLELPAAAEIGGFNHITLSVADLDRSWAFYIDVLKLRPLARWKRGAYLLAGNDTWICLHADASARASALPEYTHLALSVRPEAFGAVADRLRSMNVVEWQPNTSEGDSLYLLDPDGHKLELHAGNWQTRLAACRAKPYDGMVFFDP